MPTKRYTRKNSRKLRKIRNTRKNKRGGGKGDKSISMKSLTSTMKDIFGEQMKALPSRSQPTRASKSRAQSFKEAVKNELDTKQKAFAMKKENKRAFNQTMDELASKLERVLK